MVTAIREVMVGPQANRSALSRRPAWRSVHQPADPRAVWTERIALAPSPTAAATRFIDPDRKSPVAKASGWLVSKRQRAAAQLSPGRAEQCAIKLGAGEPEAVVIDGDVLEPAGGRGGAYKAEQAPVWLVAVRSV